MVQVEPLLAFKDNYIWYVSCNKNKVAAVVDPGDANTVLARLNQNQHDLEAILVTHHHWDHTDGILALKEHFPNAVVYGPANSPYEHIDVRLREGDSVELPYLSLNVIETPGHTLDHVCYVANDMLFCGDTLFHGGCGRLFEGTATQMWQSLQKLARLPDHTKVFCTHEYTLANLEFALKAEPDNPLLIEAQKAALNRRAKHQPTLPTDIKTQKGINPFLRAQLTQLKDHIPVEYQTEKNQPEAIFLALRLWKNHA
ncbi:Hydroxyacylglutathione hydrolase [Pseudoalteromonas luteoviolacea B = ATCC 29581]|nr:Hydroxyacylglutathione hydrolase [Pseudoalteromonas luteoviolacea B = ATCC 29581]